MDQACGGSMEVIHRDDKFMDRGGGTISRCPSWLLGRLGNRDRLLLIQVDSAYYGNEVGVPLQILPQPPEGI